MTEGIRFEGINDLARVLTGQMKRTAEHPLTLDFGVIQGDYSLKTNTFPLPIPVEDYLVCRQLTLGKKRARLMTTQITGKPGDGSHPHGTVAPPGQGVNPGISWEGIPVHPASEGQHIHDVLIPESMRSIKPGDRVLVAWVGNDAVVIDMIMPAVKTKETEWEPYA